MISAEFPSQIVTNVETHSVTITPDIEASLPGVRQAFADADRTFLDNPEQYLHKLETSAFKFQSSEGSKVACSLLYDPDSKQDEILVIFAPFADSAPKSSADKLNDYLNSDSPSGIVSKEKYAPNSWNQTTKSAAIFELLKALGKNLPVLTIYGPVPTSAYSYKERSKFRNGDFSPAGKLAKEAITHVQDRLHGPNSETQINIVHFSGASLGASNAIGSAASKGVLHNFAVSTATAQELILGPDNLLDLAKRFTVRSIIGEASMETVSQDNPKIEETAMRKAVDIYGYEIIGKNIRTLKGMKPTYMRGLTKTEPTVQAVERLLDNQVDLLVALAENSSLTHQTASFLPDKSQIVLALKGEKGQKLGHLAGDHVALSALVTALNLKK